MTILLTLFAVLYVSGAALTFGATSWMGEADNYDYLRSVLWPFFWVFWVGTHLGTMLSNLDREQEER